MDVYGVISVQRTVNFIQNRHHHPSGWNRHIDDRQANALSTEVVSMLVIRCEWIAAPVRLEFFHQTNDSSDSCLPKRLDLPAAFRRVGGTGIRAGQQLPLDRPVRPGCRRDRRRFSQNICL